MPPEKGSSNWSQIDLAYFAMLAQTSFEIVVPIGLGMLLDNWLDTRPWCTGVGAVLGLVGGLFHMVILVNRHEAKKKTENESRPPQ